MPSEEKVNKRHFPVSCFNKPYSQDCLKPGCDGVLYIEGLDTWEIVPAPPGSPFRETWRRTHHEPGVREGQMWGCPKCFTPHEFYKEYATSATPGLSMVYGVVRALFGEQERAPGEPGVGEFVE